MSGCRAGLSTQPLPSLLFFPWQQEYPAAHAETFPVHLGNCQTHSSVEFDDEGMRWRNIVWWVAASGWGTRLRAAGSQSC